MALARLDIPGVMLYGGSIPPGRFQGRDVTIQDVFEAVGAHAAGKITDEELHELEDAASPGAGACGGQFTANTMAMAFEVLGISPVGSRDGAGRGRRQGRGRLEAGRLVVDVLRARPAPEPDHHQRGARERDRRRRHARGGSTNAVLHLLAVAREIGVRARRSTTSTPSARARRCCAT